MPAIVMSYVAAFGRREGAFDLLISGKPVGAREALEMGLITKVYPDARFQVSVDARP